MVNKPFFKLVFKVFQDWGPGDLSSFLLLVGLVAPKISKQILDFNGSRRLFTKNIN